MLMGRSSKERVTENKHKSPREAHGAGLPAKVGGTEHWGEAALGGAPAGRRGRVHEAL